MRPWIIGFAVLAATLSAGAEDSITLSRSNKMGVTVVDKLSRDGEKYLLNYHPLSKSKNKFAADYWALARAIKSSGECGAGKFVILREEAKRKIEVIGCAYGDEYGKLIAALYKLK